MAHTQRSARDATRTTTDLAFAPPRDNRLKLTEIFYSLQGETCRTGLPTVFIRLTGCPLRCQYCDSAYAFTGGKWWLIDAILAQVKSFNTPYVTVTGGEPLAQKNCLALLAALCDAGFNVSLETSGALDISAVDARVVRVMDLKTPDSNECQRNRLDNIACLTVRDEVKFVICSRQDYQWAKSMVAKYDLATITQVLFSPSVGQCSPTQLADWILADQLPVRLQIQLHKVLWGDTPGK